MREMNGAIAAGLVAGALLFAASATVNIASADGASSTPPDLNQHGLTGSWFEPATSGQGFEVEIFPSVGFAQVSWFTYDTIAGGADRQRWYTMGGAVASGQPSIPLTIYRNTGGSFNALPVTAPEVVGSATLRFDSCTSGTLNYSFTDGSNRAGSIPLTRLTQNVSCTLGSAPPTNADFALSGNWFDAATAGQGITVEVNPASGALFFAWYTYAPNGAALGVAGQRWYTGQSTFVPGERSLPFTLYETTGGVFDAPSTPPPSTAAVGSGTLAFSSCAAATLSFNFTGGSSSGKSGAINLVRVGPTPSGCGAAATAEAKGLWRGATASGRTITALVLEDGTYYMTYTAPDSTMVAGGWYGTSTSSGGHFASVTGRIVELRSSFLISPAVSGTYVAQSSLALTFGAGPTAETAVLTYDAGYGAPAPVGPIVGSYRGYTGHTQDYFPMTATFDAAGRLTVHGGCNPIGTAHPRAQTGAFDIVISSDCYVKPGILLYEAALSRLTVWVPLKDNDMAFVTGIKE